MRAYVLRLLFPPWHQLWIQVPIHPMGGSSHPVSDEQPSSNLLSSLFTTTARYRALKPEPHRRSHELNEDDLQLIATLVSLIM